MTWKILILGVLGLVLAPALARAQVVTLGVYGGVNVTRTEAASATTRPVVGASLDLTLFAPLALRVEAEYGERGGALRAGAGEPTGPTEPTDTLGYLALPVNLRYDVLTGRVPVYLFAGTTVAALLFATQAEPGNPSTGERAPLRPIDVTLDLGGGIGYRASPRVAVMVDVRYSLGLLDDARSEDAVMMDAWRTRDVKIVLGVTYTFNPLAPAPPSMPGLPGMAPGL